MSMKYEPNKKAANQCDGCQRGLPLVASRFGGKIHKGNGYDMIACTADRYKNTTP